MQERQAFILMNEIVQAGSPEDFFYDTMARAQRKGPLREAEYALIESNIAFMIDNLHAYINRRANAKPRPVYVLLTDNNDGMALIACPDGMMAREVGQSAIWSDGGVSAWLVPEMAVTFDPKIPEILKNGGRCSDLAVENLPEEEVRSS